MINADAMCAIVFYSKLYTLDSMCVIAVGPCQTTCTNKSKVERPNTLPNGLVGWWVVIKKFAQYIAIL